MPSEPIGSSRLYGPDPFRPWIALHRCWCRLCPDVSTYPELLIWKQELRYPERWFPLPLVCPFSLQSLQFPPLTLNLVRPYASTVRLTKSRMHSKLNPSVHVIDVLPGIQPLTFIPGLSQ
jgi:hypothetical protein